MEKNIDKISMDVGFIEGVVATVSKILDSDIYNVEAKIFKSKGFTYDYCMSLPINDNCKRHLIIWKEKIFNLLN